ncbi:uncharacterized protein PHACADRAFT_162317 [Phanerochaete carnosa HHB-10118-sp]|uniref:Fat storage-inducing transmembrane protein n=1 Tax=Phanerochaete carnosa (strain HHB-10118-sp) TaxID=650164 RepID=K5UVB1_PHACS|nr:uncharacterized protein PHACADRAFT_162317 [Phanerochaete carnosa HHB-10118-sp]EKM53941.1 hypothetical protein PHACADRAFT_162317 [Phanerochaete carnosa HHB-10118-sp]
MSGFPKKTLAALSAIVLFGTAYSFVYGTYMDTSDPLLTHLPHLLHKTHYFATKSNILNVLFVKKLWAWTSAAFVALYVTSPVSLQTRDRIYKYLAETATWLLFTGWFFGPSLFQRFTASTGGECIMHLPSGAVVTVPHEFCYQRSALSTTTHPELFQASISPPDKTWSQVPRLRRGHDVSGHLFLLTMTILFLTEQVSYSFRRMQAAGGHPEAAWSTLHKWAVASAVAVIALSFFATYTTSVYFHTPLEKLSGFLLGVAGYAVTRTDFFVQSLL